MTRSGTLYLLPPLVRLTSVIASGSSRPLPTPRASDYDAGPWTGHNGPNLLGALLPTPSATSLNDCRNPQAIVDRRERQKAKHRNGNGFGLNLGQWATLKSAGLLPTPQAQDSRNCADYSDGSRGHSPQLRHLGSGRLNPRFVEWMMGLPTGWTDADGLDKTEPG